MEVFTDLDFAKNVAIMSETLEILILALKILHEEFSDRNCKLLGPKPRSGPPVTSAVYPQQFPFSAIRLTMWIHSFVYLGSCVDSSGGNDQDIQRRIEPAHSCMKALDHGIWSSCISVSTKLQCPYASCAPV